MADWQIDLTFDEDDVRTDATARLKLPDGTELRAQGHQAAQHHPQHHRAPVSQLGLDLAGHALQGRVHGLLVVDQLRTPPYGIQLLGSHCASLPSRTALVMAAPDRRPGIPAQ